MLAENNNKHYDAVMDKLEVVGVRFMLANTARRGVKSQSSRQYAGDQYTAFNHV